MTNTINELPTIDMMIYNSYNSKKTSIKDKILFLLKNECMTKENYEDELENIEDEIDEYRENESDEWDDLNLINDLISKKEYVENGINQCESEIERFNTLLNRLKFTKNTDMELDKFCTVNGF